MEEFKAFADEITISPSGCIKGMCKFIGISPQQWSLYADPDFMRTLSLKDRTIAFTVGEKTIVELPITKANIISCIYNADASFSMEITPALGKNWTRIFIHRPAGFPHTSKYAEYFAYRNE